MTFSPKQHTLSLLRNVPGLKKQFSKTRSTLKYNNFYFKKVIKNNLSIINNILNKNHYSYSKDTFEDIKEIGESASIEINNSCNINCVMCDTKSSTRQKQLMNLGIFEDSVIKLKKQNIKSITLHTIGDPLANVKLKDYLSILRKHKLPIGFLSTNGLLIHKHLDTLVEYIDILGNIRFSIDGATKKTYEKIRAGGSWEDLISNIKLAEKKLLKQGYEFYFDYIMTLENFSELGEFFTYFRKYVYSPFNINFHFMNSLAPSNKYFLLNNILPKHTHPNTYCKYVAQTKPHILADGKISLCSRDYDGSLVIGNIKGNESLDKLNESLKLQNLKEANLNNDISKNNYPLCSTCFIVDRRIEQIWRTTAHYIIFKTKSNDANIFQFKFEKLLNCLNDLSIQSYQNLIKQIN